MSDLADAPLFPPLLSGEAVGTDPFAAAVERAAAGVRPGTILYRETEGALSAAIVLAPELPLADAVGVVFALQLALVDSLGALGPPELAVHLVWPDRARLNGAVGPVWRAAASHDDPDAEPDWLVVAVDIPLYTPGDRPGDTPERTTLAEEGFEPIGGRAILESLSRHMLVWINRFVDDGFAAIGPTWTAACDDVGGEIAAPVAGRMLGIDERGGLLVSCDGRTRTLPLTTMLQ
ncbi:hypothetical protein DLJ53_21105 [Acuticoccus sediminis]|uniref:BPL/LPL catalytic domain-containing protein n=1 Tax=Acuticoccus sediminis TaxID=2184697 RepID=A0A8B2NWX8_9HYPH|nr:biotin/lipoate--protein ligase family protein [Acuticoccus sediminis]RAI00207.1 hypothetical protein DLJ53_21105 [Acuticoccus sediminis]